MVLEKCTVLLLGRECRTRKVRKLLTGPSWHSLYRFYRFAICRVFALFWQGRCGIKHACKRTWCIRCCSVCFCSCFVPELSLFACACSVLPAVLVLLCQQSLSAGWLPEVSKSRAAQHGGSSVFLVGKIASMRLFGLTIVSTFCEIVVFFCSLFGPLLAFGA